MKARRVTDERAWVSARSRDQVLAAAEADLRRRARRMVRELAPRLAMKSRAEIRWIWRAAVHALCDELDQIWQAKIASMPTVGARGLAAVSRSADRRDAGDRP
jgi:hypothetical protein